MEKAIVIEIDSATEEVSLACVALDALLSHYSLPKLLCYKITVCVDEVLNNIIEHDLKFESGRRIRIQMSIEGKIAHIILRYRFKQLDLGKWRTTKKLPDASQLPERGFGCYLVSEIMDEVDYGREGEENVFSLKKRLAQPAVRKPKVRVQHIKEH